MRPLARLLAGLATAIGLAATPAAHDLGVARVKIVELEPGRYRVEACSAAKVELEPPVFPARFRLLGEPTLRARARSWLYGFEFEAESGSLVGDDEVLLPWDREGAFVRLLTCDGRDAGRYFESEDGGVRIAADVLLGAERTLGETLEHYSVLGVEHILFGWDHLAFVLCLCLIARGWRLARLVTAFTLGHSLTLGAAVLGIARVPIGPVEACIALSIAFVAREAIVHGRESRHGAGLVAAFGLLHGLGFASALGESGIQASEMLPGLVAFNLGVELGQLLFVFAAVGLATAALRLAPRMGQVAPVAARALGVVAVFWTIERALGMTAFGS